MTAPLDPWRCALGGATLIEASAGTGKTWTICVLVLRLVVERGLGVDRILVVTFTQAATAELRERIRSRIVQAIAVLRGTQADSDDGFVAALLHAARAAGVDAVAALQRLDLARASFDEAAIHTIHGWAQRALADAAFAAGMPLARELLENDATLRREAAADVWRRHVSAATDPAIAACLDPRNDTPQLWARLLQRRLGKPLATLRWPDAIDAPPPRADLDALRRVHAAARAEWQARRDAIVAAVVAGREHLNAGSYKPESIRAAAVDWERLVSTDDPLPGLHARFDKLELLGSAKLRACTKKNCTTPRDAFFDLAQALLDARESATDALTAHRLRLLRTLLDEGSAALRAAKRERRVVGFDDMLFDLHQRLADGAHPWLAAQLRQRFPVALIDEFQDTDPLQFAIVRAIYGDAAAPLFLVGDPKQAIYGFRNADLQTYLGARCHVQAEATLAHNQRSVPALIDALNALFGANERAFLLPGLRYAPVAAGSKPKSVLVDTSGGPRAPLQAWLLPVGEDGRPPKKEIQLDAAAEACAADIARLLRAAADGRVTLDGRALAAGDIAVLVRTHRQGNLVRSALRALGIGSAELSQASVFHTSDADELQRLLAAVLEPARDGLVRAALATEILGRDAAAIQRLDADDATGIAIATRFAGWRDTWRERGIAAMLRELMRDERVAERLLQRADGERRMTNLLHLAERLQHAAATERSPQTLLAWLARMRGDERADEAAQLRLDSDRNLVQIVTVHKAKGLEYPIVYCPYLWDLKGPPQRGDGMDYHTADGSAVIDFRPEARNDDTLTAAVRDERAAEELRLAYVALTRAVHRVTLVSSTQAGARAIVNWLVAGSDPAAWFDSKTAPGDIGGAWQRLAAAAPGVIAVSPLPRERGVPVDAPRPSVDAICALDPPARIPPPWRIGSYSGLMAGAGGLEPDPSADDEDATAADTPAAVPVDGDDILAFPRGTGAGTCLHAMLERADFADAATWQPAVRAGLALVPQRGAASPAQLERMAFAMLADVARAPLPCGFALQDVRRARRVDELEFHLPSHALDAARLARLLARHGIRIPPLHFATLTGYLSGFIDTVFEHDGRWWIVDWKSNHLGTAAADYAAAALDAAVAAHGHALQALLYCVALDRHLALRLPGYDRRAQLGGALVLFVRGLRADWPGAGANWLRPDAELIDALSRLLERGR